jgi:hypothetical protein
MARTQLVHRERRLRTPPMAYVEEVFPEEPIQAPLEHLLFTVPDNWQPPSNLLGETTMDATGEQQERNTGEAQLEEFPTCYIEEEILEALNSQEAAPAAGHISVNDIESVKEKQAESQGPEAAMEQQSGATTSEAEDTRSGGKSREGGKSWEGGKALAPPPISTMQESWHVQPPFFHPEHLDLMFDLRSQVADQVHRGILISQRIDMLYDAFSNAPAGQRCPTCAQPFVMPARAGAQEEDVDMATSEATR